MKFLRNAWYMAAWSESLAQDEMLARTMIGVPLVLYRTEDGTAVALLDRCPHRFAPMSLGTLERGGITCGYHGLEFGHDGVCTRNPHADGKIPRKAVIPTYPVVEKDSIVWVWMGEREPDESMIPDYGILDDPGVTRRDHLLMQARYDLIVDNLLDCSHGIYLHAGVLSTLGMAVSETRLAQDGNTITVSRSSENVEPPKIFDMQFKDDGQPVDTWTEFRWDPPSAMLLDVGVTAPGEPRSDGMGMWGIHIVTPESETSTHYFTVAVRWGIRQEMETPDRLRMISDMRREAFAEQDEPMIAAQQRIIELTRPGDNEQVLLPTDIGVVRWRRIFDKLLADEGQADGA